MPKDLIIWTKEGKTMKFEQVTNLEVNDEYIDFYYYGISTQKNRKARFITSSIAGFALEQD